MKVDSTGHNKSIRIDAPKIPEESKLVWFARNHWSDVMYTGVCTYFTCSEIKAKPLNTLYQLAQGALFWKVFERFTRF